MKRSQENCEIKQTTLKELAILFFRLGATSFGGPAVHLAMMEDEVVRRRQWLTPQQFLDMLAATNFIPGPNSTEMAIHVGYERAGVKGLVVAGVSFIAPAVMIVTVLAWAYSYFQGFTVATGFLYGIKPVVIGVVAQALWRLGKSSLKNKFLIILALCSALANFAGLGELTVLGAAALISAVFEIVKKRKSGGISSLRCVIGIPLFQIGQGVSVLPSILAVTSTVASISLWKLFFTFLKIGSILFGSGYVLLAFLQADLVDKLGWLTEAQLLDAVAIGQITPGPVFSTATFIGYLLSGPSGAVTATLGIFLPAFFFVAVSAPLIPYFRRSPLAAKVLDGLNVASLALMAVVSIHLGRAAIVDSITFIFALLSSLALLRWKMNSTWIIVAAALLGVLKVKFLGG